MAGERELIWGETPTAAQWRSADDSTSGNFVVAEDMDGGTVLLEYDTTANEWVSRGPVNMSGNDVSNVGALDAASISTDGAVIGDTELISPSVDIDDDSVYETNQRTGLLVFYGRSAILTGGIYYTEYNTLLEAASGGNVTVQSTQLTGTTGPDGSINLAVVDGTFYVENRLGATRTIGWYWANPAVTLG